MEVPGMRGLFLVLVGSVAVLFLFSSLALIRQRMTPRQPLNPAPRQRRTPGGSGVEEGSEVKVTLPGRVQDGGAVVVANASAPSATPSSERSKVVTPKVKVVTPSRVKVVRDIKVAAEDGVVSEEGREGSSRTGGEGGAGSKVKTRSQREGDSEGQTSAKVKDARTERNVTRSEQNPVGQRVKNGTRVQAESGKVKKARQEDHSKHQVKHQPGKNATSEIKAEAKVEAKGNVRSKDNADTEGKGKSAGAVRRGSNVKVGKNVGVGTNQRSRRRRRRRQSNKMRSKSLLAPVVGPHGNRVDSHQSVFKVNQSTATIERPGFVADGTQPAIPPVSNLSAPSTTPTSKSAAPTFRSATPISRSATPTSKSATPTSKSATPTSKSATPTSRSATPTSRSATPTSKSATPTSKSATPTSKSATPTSKSATPTSKSATPIFRSATPSSQSVTAAAILATPTSSDGSASRLNAIIFRSDERESGTPPARMDAPTSKKGAPLSEKDPVISRATTPTSRSSAPNAEPDISVTKLVAPRSKSEHSIPGPALSWKQPRWESPDDESASYEYRGKSSSSLKASGSNRSAAVRDNDGSVQRNLDSSLVQVPVEQMKIDRHDSIGKAMSQSEGVVGEEEESKQKRTSDITESTRNAVKVKHDVVSHDLSKYNRSYDRAARPLHTQEDRNLRLGSEFAIKTQRVSHRDVPKRERSHETYVEKHPGISETDTHKSQRVNETETLKSSHTDETERQDSQSARGMRVLEHQRIHGTDVQRSQSARETNTQHSLSFPDTNTVDSRRTQETAVSGVLVQGRLVRKPRHAHNPHVSELEDSFGKSKDEATR